jgi:hypothetical protein
MDGYQLVAGSLSAFFAVHWFIPEINIAAS